MPFFIIFLLIPISELLVFVSVSDKIGLGTALLMSLFTAILGGAIVKYQGIVTISSAHESMSRGVLPSKELFDGLCIVAAGATLITPGFLTDAIGFALLIPAFRDMVRNKLVQSGKFQTASFGTEYADFQDPRQPADPTIIEAEYETVDDKDDA